MRTDNEIREKIRMMDETTTVDEALDVTEEMPENLIVQMLLDGELRTRMEFLISKVFSASKVKRLLDRAMNERLKVIDHYLQAQYRRELMNMVNECQSPLAEG